MEETLTALANTPLPTIFVICGIAFIFIAIGGQFGAHIVSTRVKPMGALVIGAVFTLLGVSLYIYNSGTPSASPASGSLVRENGSHQSNDNTPRIVLTTGLTANNDPVDNVTQIPITTDRIYIFSSWHGLTRDTEHEYLIEIRDGEGTLVVSYQNIFTPTASSWDTWVWYRIKTNIDAPGIWKFKVSYGDQSAEASLIVLNQ